MTLYLRPSGVNDMWLPFWIKRKPSKEAQIEAIKNDTLNKLDKASKSLKKVNDVLDRDDVTLKIYYATRDRRKRNG